MTSKPTPTELGDVEAAEIAKRQCTKCRQFFPFSQFNKATRGKLGIRPRCMSCKRKDDKILREKHRVKRLEYLKFYRENKGTPQRFKPKKVSRKLVYADKVKRPHYRDQSNARTALAAAIKKGKVIKPSGCMICTKTPIQAHHSDYNKPLDVLWLCREHHLAWHYLFIPIRKGEICD